MTRTSPSVSLLIACLASGCASHVSIGRNDDAVTSNSGTSATNEPADGRSCAFDGASWPEFTDAGWERGTTPSAPPNTFCTSRPITEAADIVAFYSTNDPGVLDTWVSIVPESDPTIVPDWLNICSAGDARSKLTILLSTAGGSEQLAIPSAPVHVDVGQRVVFGIHQLPIPTANGEAWTRLSTVPVTGGLPCAPTQLLREVDGPWQLEPGEEETICTRVTLTRAIDATFVRVSNAEGTLDSVLSAGDPTGADGQEICTQADDASNVLAIANGAGSVEARLTNGSIAAGQQIVLRVHAVDTDDKPHSGTTTAKLY